MPCLQNMYVWLLTHIPESKFISGMLFDLFSLQPPLSLQHWVEGTKGKPWSCSSRRTNPWNSGTSEQWWTLITQTPLCSITQVTSKHFIDEWLKPLDLKSSAIWNLCMLKSFNSVLDSYQILFSWEYNNLLQRSFLRGKPPLFCYAWLHIKFLLSRNYFQAI